MKKTVVMLLTVVFMLSMLGVFASAESYSDEIVSFEVPEIFSSKTENSLDGADYIQWTNPETSSNVSLTVDSNSYNASYADLSEVQLLSLKASYIAQIEKEIKDGLEMYSIDFEFVESTAGPIETGDAKGTRIDMKVNYIYSDGNVVPADMVSCFFSTQEKTIAISAVSKSDEEKEAVESLLQSVQIKGEIYVVKSGIKFGTVGFIIIGAIVGGLIGLIIAVTQKKKKQKLNQATQQPVQYPVNGGAPYQPNNMSQGYGMPNEANRENYNISNQQNNTYYSPDSMNPNYTQDN